MVPGNWMKRDSLYNSSQFDANYPDGSEYHFWIAARNRIIEKILGKYAKADDGILEIGCGKGIVLNHLLQKGCHIWGFEPAVIPSLNGVDRRIFKGCRLEDIDEDIRKKIRVVLLLDVIEHIENPSSFIAAILSHLPNARSLILTVPARNELWANYDEYFGHYRRYDIPMLRKLGESIPMRLAQTGYFFHLLYIPMRLKTLLGSDRATSLVPPRTRRERRFHRIVSEILIADERLIPRCLPGSSLWACYSIPRRIAPIRREGEP